MIFFAYSEFDYFFCCHSVLVPDDEEIDSGRKGGEI